MYKKDKRYEFPKGNNACIICRPFFKSEASNEVDVKHSGSYHDVSLSYRVLFLFEQTRGWWLQVSSYPQSFDHNMHGWDRLLMTKTSKNNSLVCLTSCLKEPKVQQEEFVLGT